MDTGEIYAGGSSTMDYLPIQGEAEILQSFHETETVDKLRPNCHSSRMQT